MPRIQIPNFQNRQWSGIFPGEDSGLIFSGRGIDLERNKGKVGLADSYSDLFDSSEAGFSNLTTPIAFVRSSADNTDRWWTNAGRLFKTTNTNPETGWAEDAITDTPTAPLYDLIDFAGALIVPTSTDLSRLAAGIWTASWWQGTLAQPALTANPHRFFILAGALVFTDGRLIHDFDGTVARSSALTLPTGFRAEGGVVLGEIGYIFGAQIGGGETYVYVWDRISTNYLARYPVGDTEILCAFVIDSVYIVTKKGLIKRFNGSAFEIVQQFPTVETQGQINSIHPNGVSVTENIAKIFVDFGVIGNTRVSSGFWIFDALNRNLYNAGSVRNTTTRDYAQYELAGAGALKQTAVNQGLYLVGAQVYASYSGTTRYGIFSSDENGTSNQGYFITSKLRAQNVRRFWRYIFPILRRMDNADDRVRIAFRFSDSNELPAYETITWLTASTFTASNSDIGAGDIVEVIAGENAGAIARITDITGTTVTIDRSLYSSTASARVRYLRFIDIGNIANVQLQSTRFIFTVRSEWVQFLIEMRGSETSPSLESLIIDFKEIPV